MRVCVCKRETAPATIHMDHHRGGRGRGSSGGSSGRALATPPTASTGTGSGSGSGGRALAAPVGVLAVVVVVEGEERLFGGELTRVGIFLQTSTKNSGRKILLRTETKKKFFG